LTMTSAFTSESLSSDEASLCFETEREGSSRSLVSSAMALVFPRGGLGGGLRDVGGVNVSCALRSLPWPLEESESLSLGSVSIQIFCKNDF